MKIVVVVGWIEAIVGCMFSGKTEELQRRVRRAEIAGRKVLVVKPAIDDRYSINGVVSHIGNDIDGIPVCMDKPREILDLLGKGVNVVAIDEAQFFYPEIVGVITALACCDIRVVVAGLNLDFRGEPFGAMPQIMCIADQVTTLHAICMVCGSEQASRTQRLVDGAPAHYNERQILIGAEESYQARCRKHHVVPM
ncbi:MAG: Thymidine kinase [Candidatus Woesebacteria bacterium GW2011_GWB1_43_14]|uniref:Thymidine kinase n=1 Tax=Candidatus Woesebacteria bacterium GW2011_GWB1_43_14 TaxID=1618578 RepID=A0A0G1GDR3_9BACT|nr:MAG: Thymidine kinase [Candidatus Woesebacteria bacterium GW2011_GWC1_42_9]KKS97018.1 MAG: Thymidine kinase [Candidatus Woesebacteria bacterium GW2011_GWB1_43_14]